MGYQQKLLLVSSLFIIGLGIVAGIRKYHSAEAEANFRVLMLDAMDLASKARAYYHTPVDLMGGGRSFAGLTSDKRALERLFSSPENENGTFQILPAQNDQSLIIQATGKNDSDNDGKNLTIQVFVFPDNVQSKVISW